MAQRRREAGGAAGGSEALLRPVYPVLLSLLFEKTVLKNTEADMNNRSVLISRVPSSLGPLFTSGHPGGHFQR